jgi:hypothetical protein
MRKLRLMLMPPMRTKFQSHHCQKDQRSLMTNLEVMKLLLMINHQMFHPRQQASMMLMPSVTLQGIRILMLSLIQSLTMPQLVSSKEDLVLVPRDSPISRPKDILMPTQSFNAPMERLVQDLSNKLVSTGKMLATRTKPWLPPLLTRTTFHSDVLKLQLRVACAQEPFGSESLFVQTMVPRLRLSRR